MIKTDFSSSNILVVGDVMLDQYIFGKVERISPEAPVPVFQFSHEESRLGGAANVAKCAARLGMNVNLIGIIGLDLDSDRLTSLLSKVEQLEDSLIRDENETTIKKTRYIANGQQFLRLDNERYFDAVARNKVKTKFKDLIVNSDLVIISDYNKGTVSDSSELIKIAKLNNVPVIVDPKGSDWEKYRGASVITPNLKEFKEVGGNVIDDDAIHLSALEIVRKYDLEKMLVTKSEKGMSLITTSELYSVPALESDVFDVTGAGDCVIAAFSCALSKKLPLRDAVNLANQSASICVQKLGTYAPTLSEINSNFAITEGNNNYELQPLTVDDIFARERLLGHKIVMTNGCFDILHPGHIRYLQEARKLGDVLIVAINSDESVQALKGEGRPINSQNTRVEMLKALKCVDHVVTFDAETPLDLYKKYTPDILVKGADYETDSIIGSDFVKKRGGEVIRLGFHDGFSTTDIIKNIRGEK
jgi:D-beta-D-heptose 7-phosphate kinase / D-beta-D-heptose 1-phosphate adenosyltransferase